MATTPTTHLGLSKLANGDDPGVWDVPINANWDGIDLLFDASVGIGHIHDGTHGNGPQIDHADLIDGGATTHANIDAHIGDATKHFLEATVLLEVEDDGSSIETGVTKLNFVNARSVTMTAANIVEVDVSPTPTGGTGPLNGVPSHYHTTYAPVATVDHFLMDDGRPLSDGDWYTQTDADNIEMVYGTDKAVLYVDRLRGDIATGSAVNRVKTASPHSPVQRVTVQVPHVDVAGFAADGGDSMSFQLALMASALPSATAISRLGFFYKIDLHKEIGGSIVMTRSIVAHAMVNTLDVSVASTLWQDVGIVDKDTRHYRGKHEFSLDRNGAFHVYWNDGPVDIGTAGTNLAATPYIATLRTSLLNEHTEYPQNSGTGPIPVSPEYGRFGLDVSWDVPETGRAGIEFKHFSACGLDDESQFYNRVRATEDDNDVIKPVRHPKECCSSGTKQGFTVGDTIEVPAVSSAPTVSTVNYQVTELITAGDLTYGGAGMLMRPSSTIGDANVTDDIVYCSDMSGAVLDHSTASRPGEWGRVTIRGANLTSLLDDVRFLRSDPSIALDDDRPAGAGTFGQGLPYPEPVTPNVGTAATVVWPLATDLDEKVIVEVKTTWTSQTLVIDYLVAEGMPYGTAFDIIITDRLDNTNQQTFTKAVVLSAPNTVMSDVRFYKDDITGGSPILFARTETLEACKRLYATVYVTGAPLPLIPATNTTQSNTPWGGFPFDMTTVTDAYLTFEENTPGTATTELTLVNSEVRKGRYLADPVDIFPPPGFTPASREGETIFLTYDVSGTAYDRRFGISISHPNEPSATGDTFLFPTFTSPTPVVTSVAYSTVVAGLATITVTGLCFNNVTLTESGVAGVASSITQSPTQVQFDTTTTGNGTATMTIANEAGVGGSVVVNWTVGTGSSPTISGAITPTTIDASSKNVEFTIDGTLWDEGVVITTTPVIPFISSVITTGAVGPATIVLDVPSGAGTIGFVATNPNGNASSTVSATVTANVIVANTLTFLVPATGQEPGASGTITITSTGNNFRDGITISSSEPEHLLIGNRVAFSSALVSYDYELTSTSTVGNNIVITLTDPDGSTTTVNFDVEENTPEISYATFANDREGAGASPVPDSAKVAINGRYFSNVLAGAVTLPTANGTITGVTVVNDTLITIDDLAINAGEGDPSQPLTIRLTTSVDAKVTDHTIQVGLHHKPKVSGWTVKDGSSLVLDPKVIAPSAVNHEIELYGTGLAVTAADLTGAVNGGYSVDINQGSILFTNVSIPAVGSADRAIIVELTPIGTSTKYLFEVATVDTNIPGTPTITSTVQTDFVEGSKSAVIEITGTNLHPNSVGRISLDVASGSAGDLPLSIQQDASSRSAITVLSADFASTGFLLTATVDIMDLTAAAGEFDLTIYAPNGTAITTFGTAIDVDPNTDRVGFDYVSGLPTPNVVAGDPVDYTFTLDNAEGGELLEVIGAGAGAIVNVDTANPSTVRVTFTNPGSVVAVETRLYTVAGKLASIFSHVTL